MKHGLLLVLLATKLVACQSTKQSPKPSISPSSAAAPSAWSHMSSMSQEEAKLRIDVFVEGLNVLMNSPSEATTAKWVEGEIKLRQLQVGMQYRPDEVSPALRSTERSGPLGTQRSYEHQWGSRWTYVVTDENGKILSIVRER